MGELAADTSSSRACGEHAACSVTTGPLPSANRWEVSNWACAIAPSGVLGVGAGQQGVVHGQDGVPVESVRQLERGSIRHGCSS